MKFIVDHNVGKLVRLLRMMGYDTVFFTGKDDWQMVVTALSEDRVILTRDTQLMERGVIANGRVKAVLIKNDNPELQIKQVIEKLGLDTKSQLFTRCLEDNQLLEERTREQISGRVPPYVFETQDRYMECPSCRRIYWQGTHWKDMIDKLSKLG
jgi:uncharacterized protein